MTSTVRLPALLVLVVLRVALLAKAFFPEVVSQDIPCGSVASAFHLQSGLMSPFSVYWL